MLDRFETFCITIAHLNKSLQKLRAMAMGKIGLKGTHTMCLYYCGKNSTNGVTLKELRELCEEDKAGISRSIKELTKLGIICTKHPQNNNKKGYKTKFFLTESGLEAYQFLNEEIIRAVNAGGDGFSDEQRKSFYTSMEKIADNLDKYTEMSLKEQANQA